MNSVLQCRELISSVIPGKPSVIGQGEESLYARLKAAYEEEKEFRDKGRITGHHVVSNAAYFITCVGLLTYGRLDVFAEIIANLPGDRDNARNLLPAVYEVMPISFDLHNTERAKDWFDQHEARLIWDERQMRFLISES